VVAEPHELDVDARTLTQVVVPWIRFVGPVRLLGAVGAMLVVSGIAWWMLRSPALPTESRLPMAQRAAAAGDVVASTAPLAPSTVAPSPPTSAVVVIHVTGAVHAPDVYELPAGKRVADAIDAAGGALADADANALNLAAPVVDGDRIDVPTEGEASSPSVGAGSGHSHADPGAAGSDGGAPVDLNTADVAELEALPGIGPATAAAIIDHRSANGPFATVDDLEAVRGIGPAKLEAIRDYVRV
jgi:competence protein ComEA